MKKSIFICSLFLLLMSFTFPIASYAAPTINNFESLITVQTDGTIQVQENINITTDGITIQHGIYRDFPTTYKTTSGFDTSIGFHFENAFLNNVPVSYRIKNIANGIRIYLGNANRLLPAGTYTFTLMYSALGELGSFSDHDELYWNVTGNGWQYPITQASAIVTLPNGAAQNVTGYKAYTGYQGGHGENYQSAVSNDQTIQFQTTQSLAPTQGLTIVVGWKKGFIQQPSLGQLFKFNPENAFILIILELGLIGSLVFYYYIWNLFCREKDVRVIIPEYEPPQGFTPDALRFIAELGYDDKVLAVAILNLAVKGHLTIHEADKTASNSFELTKLPSDKDDLNDIEKNLMTSLFQTGDTLELKQQSSLMNIALKYQEDLVNTFTTQYMEINTKFIFIGVAIVFVTLGLTALINHTLAKTLMCVAFLAIYACLLVLSDSAPLRRINTIFCLLLVSAIGFGLLYGTAALTFVGATVWIYCILFSLIIIANFAFTSLMKHPTVSGQQLINHINGFKLFLNATEKDRLNFRNPPDQTPDIFEKYLPYALALGVEQRWAEQFSAVLIQANYQPRWYAGRNPLFNAAAFTSMMNSGFAGAVSSATAPPGSHSGFGGGSSGGGGGGGGGGGW